ncbi:unnamed protein product [Rotaria sp. Silwood2]|nr:unnamed protein product [Rotaria sp. Silwood2]CAF3032414.1 unnamed protein product [Rotaria sp. Silwood2]CAF3402188.1 unnamed protein product [Rotaria sp. Silwood2]CAF4067160.1 unnamed protein product [Rotaria sp. Silwood2]CAF4296824.1 unnamed protein product [Rotaria sp. Silwood2]
MYLKIRRGGTSNHIRKPNATKTRPITRKQSAALLCEEVNEDQFVLVELTLNKKLLVVEYNELIKLNEKVKIKIGSRILIESNGNQPNSALVFCIGSEEQCLEELNIIQHQRDYHKNSSHDAVDTSDDPSLVVTTTLTESNKKKGVQKKNGNVSKVTNFKISLDNTHTKSNLCLSSSTSSSITAPSTDNSVQLNHEQNAALDVSSLTSTNNIVITPPTALSKSINTNVTNTKSNSQCSRMDQLSSLASQLTTVTKERDCWKMLPTDESTCEWIRTVYDAIQRKANHTINFEAESAKLSMSSSLLQYCVNLSKPPATTARKMFQYTGEKLFGCLKWDRKAIKISLQNFIRGERANMKQDQHAHGAVEQNDNHDDVVEHNDDRDDVAVNEMVSEY